MIRWLTMSVALLAACAGTDEPVATNNARTNGNPNATPNSTPNNGTQNAVTNNTTATNTGSNNTSATNTGSNNTTNTNSTANNGANEWRALVANAELTGNTSTWNLVVFDGTEASVTFPQAFGTGSLAVAASGDRGYVVDLDTGMVVIVDAARGTEIETIDLGLTDLDAVAAANGILVAASGDNARIVQYSAATGGLGQPISIPAASGGSTQFVRSLAMDGANIVGVMEESAMFPTTPQLFVANASTASLVDVDPTTAGPMTLGLNGATRLDRLTADAFAVGTERDGILRFRKDGATWVSDQPVIDVFGSAEVQDVVIRTPAEGVAFTYSANTGFAARVFDATAGTSAEIDGFALASGLIGGDVSADGLYYFLGDYGIRNQADTPWGVAIVDADGVMIDHIETDAALPPASIAALN